MEVGWGEEGVTTSLHTFCKLLSALNDDKEGHTQAITMENLFIDSGGTIMLPFIIACHTIDNIENSSSCKTLYLSVLGPAHTLADAWRVSST